MRYWYEELNGDMTVTMWYSYCPNCGEYIHESYPHELIGETVICPDCAFISGYWTEEEYIKYACFGNCFVARAAVRDGKIYLGDKKYKFPWERAPKEHRHSADYYKWRTAVFERDNYTCAICGQRGGTLNAHHIKSFKSFPELRLDVDNGITFCEICHKKVHREKNSEWIHTDK